MSPLTCASTAAPLSDPTQSVVGEIRTGLHVLDDLLQRHGVLGGAAVRGKKKKKKTCEPLSTTVTICTITTRRVLSVLVRVQIHRVPHGAGVVGQYNEGPHVPRRAASLQTPTALQLQVVMGQLFNQEVCGTCGRRSSGYLLRRLAVEIRLSLPHASHKPIPAPLKPAGSTSMMWLGQYFLYTAISYSLTTRMWRCDAPSMAWYRLNRPCSWRPVVMVKIGLLMQSGL